VSVKIDNAEFPSWPQIFKLYRPGVSDTWYASSVNEVISDVILIIKFDLVSESMW